MKNDPITLLVKEADAYTGLDQIEKYVEERSDLSNLPIQPVYLALLNLPSDKVAEYLPKFSKEQRSLFLDIDLWNKDEVDVEQFSFWLQAYYLVDSDAVKKEFVESEQFLLFLKSKFNIWTFDVEEPEYPDHDNYFLTDDNLLLLEFDKSFQFVDEVRSLIRHLYYEIGVENAYTFLFKMVSDSFLIAQEEEYGLRRERMRDFGFVDYMDSLEIENLFINMDFLHNFIAKKTSATGSLDNISKNQNLHSSTLVAFKSHFKIITDELLKITDSKRSDFLQFNFIRLINSRLEFMGSLKKGSVAMTRTGAQTKNTILLGFNYLNTDKIKNEYLKNISEEGLFSLFDFTDLYKIGHSLVKFNLKNIKKSLQVNHFEEDEKFLGSIWIDFLDNSFDEIVSFESKIGKDGKIGKAMPITHYEDYELWLYKSRTLIEILPFAKKIHETFLELKKLGRLQDNYYLNYTIDSIDFEAILLSNFANFYLDKYREKDNLKLGLTLEEFKIFCLAVIDTEGKFILGPNLFKKIQEFAHSFGLERVYDFTDYLQDLIKAHLEGNNFSDLEDEEFLHIGGPIILNITQH